MLQIKQIKRWLSANVETDQKSTELFLRFKQIFFFKYFTIVEFELSLSVTNVATERGFSSINKLWTIGKTQLNIKTLNNILSVNYNLTNLSEIFYILINYSNLLQSVKKTYFSFIKVSLKIMMFKL